jgi:error-prone DNA polymerase
MGWNNPAMPWTELERRLSGRRPPPGPPGDGDGGDSPAWSRRRGAYDPPERERPQPPAEPVVPYAELHCHSNFSFLDGASHPEELVEEAVRLGLTALALTDHDGLYGIVRLAEAAAAYDIQTVYGAELSLELTKPQNGEPDPEGRHLLVLARQEPGYHRLAAALTEAQLAGREKGKPVYDLERLAERAGGEWLILTGCRKGAVPAALTHDGRAAAAEELDRLTALFGRDNVAVELWDHGDPLDSERNDALAELAAATDLPVVATNNVHYATPRQRLLATAIAAVRARSSLDELDGWLPAAGTAHLRSGVEMAARFARFPGAVARSLDLAAELAFPLTKASPRLPKLDRPPEHATDAEWLRALVYEEARNRYGPREHRPEVYGRLDRELQIIAEKDFPGYFLIVWDIVKFCRDKGILCQGRGSAANSAVCYALGITAVDAVHYKLPFERFIATTREEEPDIDVDIESGCREDVIQYVYDKYGRDRVAQVCNVISYRPRMAIRDMAKSLGYSPGQQDAWSKQVDSWGTVAGENGAGEKGADDSSQPSRDDIPPHVIGLAEQVLTFPRHLGIHSGGMVLTDRPVGEVCPIEWARMEKRSVLQWDKDDCAAMKLVKFDLLGLGMLSALRYALEFVRDFCGDAIDDLSSIPKEETAVYDMLCRADSVGVFQVESRAQMATLPRLRPRTFYDLVIEIALIRPGPIQGGAVHPYIRRKNGREPITYSHELLEPILERTLGVPLFQEQLMQIAVAAGGCTGDDADLLRRAMGSKRGEEKIERLRAKLDEGMARNGITGELADEIYDKIAAFANFGFAESHSLSFALLVYASSWLKLHYPAAFLAALLKAQPMGFYSPQSLVADAVRHGVEVRHVDVNRSAADATLEPLGGDTSVGPPQLDCLTMWELTESTEPWSPDTDGFDHQAHRRDAGFAVRLGLSSVRTIGDDLAERIAAGQPFSDMADLVRRCELTTPQVEALATAGAFAGFGLSRREALWVAGQVATERAGQLPGLYADLSPPPLPKMTPYEQTMADLHAAGVSPDSHPMQHIRAALEEQGIVPARSLPAVGNGRPVVVAGVVTHRQRPATAGGTTFLNLEDETGMINVICSYPIWIRHARVARTAAALLIRGRLEAADGVTNVVAEHISRLPLTIKAMSRDFH